MKLNPLRRDWRTYAAGLSLIAAGVVSELGYPVPAGLMSVFVGVAIIASRAAVSDAARKSRAEARAMVDDLTRNVLTNASAICALNCRVNALTEQLSHGQNDTRTSSRRL